MAAVPRQARVLNLRPSQSEGSVIPPVHYPNFYSQHYHSKERSGVVAEDSFEEDNASASSEQVRRWIAAVLVADWCYLDAAATLHYLHSFFSCHGLCVICIKVYEAQETC
ncbi:uncharacterized protein LOC135092670 [Scylla paramamosain]|uniref:uncharacterized protein LOC135092670 n=1 Tax=Scylla paramamosain TaxID=85552 RepID=UPI003083C6E0